MQRRNCGHLRRFSLAKVVIRGEVCHIAHDASIESCEAVAHPSLERRGKHLETFAAFLDVGNLLEKRGRHHAACDDREGLVEGVEGVVQLLLVDAVLPEELLAEETGKRGVVEGLDRPLDQVNNDIALWSLVDLVSELVYADAKNVDDADERVGQVRLGHASRVEGKQAAVHDRLVLPVGTRTEHRMLHLSADRVLRVQESAKSLEQATTGST